MAISAANSFVSLALQVDDGYALDAIHLVRDIT